MDAVSASEDGDGARSCMGMSGRAFLPNFVRRPPATATSSNQLPIDKGTLEDTLESHDTKYMRTGARGDPYDNKDIDYISVSSVD